MATEAESAITTWTAPECPFAIEYSARLMDEIRLSVMDAFFSLPRGGAEIGGVLLGSYNHSKLTIKGYAPIECEHAFGPGFTLSARDLAKLERLLASAPGGPAGRDVKPVGWYHSHTRSEIFLSGADLEIYNRFFPEPWQVALVLKPHTFEPMRAGFFFREAAAGIAAARSYTEFQLEGLPLERLPGMEEGPARRVALLEKKPQARGGAGPARPVTPEPSCTPGEAPSEVPSGALGRALTGPAPAAIAPSAAAEGGRGRHPEIALPKFLVQPSTRSQRWLVPALTIAAFVVLGSVIYQTRIQWWPPLVNLVHASAAGPPASLGLSAADENGQLQIRWEGNSALVRNAADAALRIVDSGALQSITLDAAHLQSGSFTYARASQNVDITLEVRQPGGRSVSEATSFLSGAHEPTLANQRDDLERENEQLLLDIKNLEKSLAEARAQLRAQQKRRVANQKTQP
jgi:hypothetical protein